MNLDLDIGVLVLLGLIPASIKFQKGYLFWLNFLAGAACLPLALWNAVVSKPNAAVLLARAERDAAARGEARCPACREFMRAEATICPHCRTAVHGREAEAPGGAPAARSAPSLRPEESLAGAPLKQRAL